MNENAKLVLVINCGSSSLKFAVFPVGEHAPILSGIAECLGLEDARIIFKEESGKTTKDLGGGTDHGGALDALISKLIADKHFEQIIAVGHRVLHGGERIKASTLVDHDVLAAIESCIPLGPLHNPPNLLGIRTAMAKLPKVPQVVVVDTAFHQTMPKEAYLYAVPQECYTVHGVRRYGFHGTSHRYVAHEAVRVLGLDPHDHGIVIAHLGNGSSATAILNGKSVDTTMGMTPLEGLVMGTRSGDIDVGAALHILREMGLSPSGLDNLLNKKSGLLGLSGLSADCRTIEAAADDDHVGAITALQVMVHRLARHIGGLAMALKRLDAIVFTGGIGENSVRVRRMTMERLAVLGVQIDEEANKKMFGGACGIISKTRTPIVAVVPTNEELMIAHDAAVVTGALADVD